MVPELEMNGTEEDPTAEATELREDPESAAGRVPARTEDATALLGVRAVATTARDCGRAGTTEAVEGRTSVVMLMVAVVEQVLWQLSVVVR